MKKISQVVVYLFVGILLLGALSACGKKEQEILPVENERTVQNVVDTNERAKEFLQTNLDKYAYWEVKDNTTLVTKEVNPQQDKWSYFLTEIQGTEEEEMWLNEMLISDISNFQSILGELMVRYGVENPCIQFTVQTTDDEILWSTAFDRTTME